MVTNMGALTEVKKYFKKGIMGIMLGSSFGALVSMVNLTGEVDDNSVKVAVENTIKNNKDNAKLVKDVNNFVKIYEISEKVSEENVKQRFDTSNTFGENEKDKDGYKQIEDRLQGIEAEVSEEKAQNETNNRQQGGKQKTMLEED